MRSYLKDDNPDDDGSDTGHDTAVVGENRFTTATRPDVELFSAVVVIIVGGVIGQVVLDAGPWRPRIATAERHAVHKVLPLHVAEDTAGGQRHSVVRCCNSTVESRTNHSPAKGTFNFFSFFPPYVSSFLFSFQP